LPGSSSKPTKKISVVELTWPAYKSNKHTNSIPTLWPYFNVISMLKCRYVPTWNEPTALL
jgi:hypothetical protein